MRQLLMRRVSPIRPAALTYASLVRTQLRAPIRVRRFPLDFVQRWQGATRRNLQEDKQILRAVSMTASAPLSRVFAVGCVFAVVMPAPRAHAEEKPLWEVGVGATSLIFPDYRGSDQSQNHVLPIPYIVYRGEFLKADRDGIRSIFFDNDNLEVNASAGASFPVDSKNNDAREGMPDLKPTVELGPALDAVLWRSATPGMKLMLRMPVRATFTVERSPEYIGWVFSPKLNLDIDDFAAPGWTLGMYVSPQYSDSRFNGYYYSVAPAYATPSRPSYEARAGYGGTELLAALWKRYASVWVGAFVRYDNLNGAVFVDSPLVRTRSNFAGGVAVSWIFSESSRRVEVKD